jgi:hypothetical protein
MEDTVGPLGGLVITVVVVTFTIVPLLIWRARVRRRWRQAATVSGLPLPKGTGIEAKVLGGRLVAGEEYRMVVGSETDQVVTSVLGILDLRPPEAFVASTDGGPPGGPTFTTGEVEFDQVVVVGSKDIEAGREYLTPRRRKALLRFFATVPQGALCHGRIGNVRDGRMFAKELTRTVLAVKNVLEDLNVA